MNYLVCIRIGGDHILSQSVSTTTQDSARNKFQDTWAIILLDRLQLLFASIPSRLHISFSLMVVALCLRLLIKWSLVPYTADPINALPWSLGTFGYFSPVNLGLLRRAEENSPQGKKS